MLRVVLRITTGFGRVGERVPIGLREVEDMGRPESNTGFVLLRFGLTLVGVLVDDGSNDGNALFAFLDVSTEFFPGTESGDLGGLFPPSRFSTRDFKPWSMSCFT